MFPKTSKPSPEVVSIIELTRMCQVFNALPREGGLFDQDARTISEMQMVLVAEVEKSEEEAKRATKKR